MNYSPDPNAFQIKDILDSLWMNLPALLDITGFPRWLALSIIITLIGWILGRPLFRKKQDRKLAVDVLALLLG